MYRLSLSLLIGSLLAVFVLEGRAQDKSPRTNLTKLAIEVVGREGSEPFTVSAFEGGYFQIGPPPRLPDWKQPSGATPLVGIRVRAVQEGEGARIKVAAIFDDSEPADAPGPKYGEREQIIASYVAQLGDTITVRELGTLGVEAITLRVVKYKEPPVATRPPAILPEVVNDLKSMAFVDLKIAKPGFVQLTVQNVSAKSIAALSIWIAPGKTLTWEGSRERPLISPGETYETSIQLDGRDMRDNLRPTLLLQTVLFDDGHYEGEVVSAAELAARSRGQRIQLARFLQLLSDDSPRPGPGTSSIITELKTSVEKFRIDADASVVDELQAQFPLLPKGYGRAWLAAKIMQGLKVGRGHAIYLLRNLEGRHSSTGGNSDQSLRALREQVTRLVGSQ